MPFPMLVSKRFVDAAQSREPIAVAVMAHYAVVLHRARLASMVGWMGRAACGCCEGGPARRVVGLYCVADQAGLKEMSDETEKFARLM
jgi:hypothetical protein